jgi:hypothetical protein
MEKRSLLELRQRVVSAWQIAADRLGVNFVAAASTGSIPYSVSIAGVLPDFGGPNGMFVALVLPDEFETDPALTRLSEREGRFLSFLNAERYQTYDEVRFKEALSDWGYWGPPENRPHWLSANQRQ